MDAITLTLNLLAIGALLVAWGLLWLRRHSVSRWKAVMAGAITFVVAARVLEPLALQASGLTGWLGSSAPARVWVIFAFALAAALFEETGRLCGLGMAHRRVNDPIAWTWSFAAGYAGAELLLIGAIGHGQLLVLAQSPDRGAALLQALPYEARAGLQRSLSELGPMSALWLVSERLAAVAFQIGLIVAGGLRHRATVCNPVRCGSRAAPSHRSACSCLSADSGAAVDRGSVLPAGRIGSGTAAPQARATVSPRIVAASPRLAVEGLGA